MENKNLAITTSLAIISSALTFSIRIDDFSEDISVIARNKSTDLQTLLNDKTGSVQLGFYPSDSPGKTIKYTNNPPGLHYSETKPVTVQYFTSKKSFDVFNYPIIKMDINNAKTSLSTKELIITLNLSDINGNVTKLDADSLNNPTFTFDLTKPFAAFNPNQPNKDVADPHNINCIAFVLNKSGTQQWDFDVNSIEAVPVPISMITLGSEIGAFIKRRKKKTSI